MWKLVALVACCGLAATPFALASEGKNTPPAVVSATPLQVAVPACTPLRSIYAFKNWREAHPARGVNACDGNTRKWKERFFLYRHYRHIAPYSGFSEGDPYLKWLAVPSYIVACETNGYSGQGRWRAANGSGAVGPYQLLGWGAPYPADTAREKVRNHEIASGLALSNWACA